MKPDKPLDYESSVGAPRRPWRSAVVLGLTAGLIGAFVFWSPWPPAIGSRIYFMILAMAVVGIPFGIKYGTQEKFWT